MLTPSLKTFGSRANVLGVPETRSGGRDWELGNGEDRHRANPRRFFVPDLRVRESLKRGDVVRLLFDLIQPAPDQPGAERMWVMVDEVCDTTYVGILGNQPAAISDLARGDRIRFEPRHVIAVQDATWDRYASLTAFVSRRLIEDDELEPSVAFHDPADEKLAPRSDGTRASGWQLLVGDESDDELSDVANVVTPNLGWLMERYPLFGRLVSSEARGGSWRLAEDGYRPDG
jgi:hypothetical protein